MARIALASAAVVVAVCIAGSALAGKQVDRSHENFTDGPFPDTFCGIDGQSTVHGVNSLSFRGDTFTEHLELTQVFTADESGKSIVAHVAQRVTGLADPIVNEDGTLTFINTFQGLPEQIRIPHGPVLSQDAGAVTQAQTYSYDPVTEEYTFISRELSGLHGPHPDLLSDFGVFCDDVIAPALT